MQLNVNLPVDLVARFKAVCSDEKRLIGAQLEIVIEDFLRRRERETIEPKILKVAEPKATYKKR